jgi:hypothetical protein
MSELGRSPGRTSAEPTRPAPLSRACAASLRHEIRPAASFRRTFCPFGRLNDGSVEETTFDRYRLNVRIDPRKFEVPKSTSSSKSGGRVAIRAGLVIRRSGTRTCGAGADVSTSTEEADVCAI